MSEEELAALWTKIAGTSTSTILVPYYTREAANLGPKFGVHWTFSELTGESESLSNAYFRTLTQSNPFSVLVVLARINNSLLVNEAFSPALHRDINGFFLRGTYLTEIANQQFSEPESKYAKRIVFHRLALLLSMRLVLCSAKPEETPEGDLEDYHSIGDMMLLANGFLTQDRDTKEMTPNEFLLEFVANWDVSNLSDTAYSMARYDLLIKDYLRSEDPKIKTPRERLHLDVGQFDGLLLDEYLTLIFAIHSTVSSSTRGNSGSVISSSALSESLRISPNSVSSFFQERSLSPLDLSKHFAVYGWNEEDLSDLLKLDRFVTDTTLLKKAPFVRLDEDRYLVLDVKFAIELLTSVLYWTIFDSLPPRPSPAREDFSSLWGDIFEVYTVDLFRHYYPDSSASLNLFGSDEEYIFDGENGQIDAFLDYGTEAIVFEIKSSLLHLDAKYGRNWERFEQEIRLKFVENQRRKPKALKQLANAAKAVINGAVLNTPPSKRKIYPVLISEEKSLECLSMNKYLNELFRSLLDEETAANVYPLTVISIDELEELLPYIGQGLITWQEIFRERFNRDEVSMFSIHQALYDLIGKRSLPRLRNERLLQRFEAVFSVVSKQCAHLRDT